MTKKILQVNTVVNAGSTGHIAEEIGLLAIGNGWDSHIAYGRNEKSSKSKQFKTDTNIEIIYHVLLTRIFDRHGLGSIKATKRLIKYIDEVNPDIIHLHNLHGYYLNIEILFNYLATIETPVVWTFHDCWPFTGHCAHFDYAGCNRWKNECYKCCQKSGYPASFLFDRSTKNFHLKKKLFTSLKSLTIVPVSNWLADIVKQSFLSEIPISVINNGIDLSTFHPVDSDKIRTKYNPKNKFIILGVASIWSPRKGLGDFIKLSKKIDKDCQIVLVGLNSKQIRNLPHNIIGLQRTESINELAEFYNCADVFINPTWEDNFPTTNLEALSCGTPVVTYRTGGSPESIDGDTGFVIEKGDIEGLLKAISIIKSRDKSYYSKACRARAERLYDKNDRFMDYIRLYESLLSK